MLSPGWIATGCQCCCTPMIATFRLSLAMMYVDPRLVGREEIWERGIVLWAEGGSGSINKFRKMKS